jgi:hypothetical protein
MRSQFVLSLVLLAGLSTVVFLSEALGYGDKTAPADKGKASGILVDRKDRTLMVRIDGEDEVSKYVLPANPDAKMAAMLKGLFVPQRVQIAYKANGDTRDITSFVRQPGKANGTITGTVFEVHNNFWVEVRPATGVPEGFALGAPDKSKDIAALLKTLQQGDKVAIRYYTDFERHRIVAMQKVEKK